ncbi:3'-phosphoadenosine 5'-phosphosulfate sulfotransferase [Geranomyces variabilis]|nr:3'-phosphoadenosine 5'-phosphosulfate sulfotransferase [Geranomyces variabilis]
MTTPNGGNAAASASAKAPICTCEPSSYAFVSPPPPTHEFAPLGDVRRVLASGSPLAELLRESYNIILEALNRYGPEGLALSFNGGKDCTVLMHLMYAAREQHAQENPTADLQPIRIKTLYVAHTDSFPEVDEFVAYCEPRYGLDLVKIYGPMREGIQSFLDRYPKVHAMLVGTRRTDPFGESLVPFQPTDNGWPDLMRVHPILDWDYAQIWQAMDELRIPHCVLYEHGYTSLGGIENTQPNPVLRNPDARCGYDPAHKLTDGGKERDGRIKKRP